MPAVRINGDQRRYSIGQFYLAVSIFTLVGLEAFLLIRVAGWGGPEILGGDGPEYHQLALNILDGFHFSISKSPPFSPTIWRTPGYPMFVALLYLVHECSFLYLRIAQFLLLAATGWILYLLAVHFVSRIAAAATALLCVTYPPLVFSPMYHLTETVTSFLMILLITALIKLLENTPRRSVYAFALGNVAGIASLVRPSLLLLIVPLVVSVAFALKRQINDFRSFMSVLVLPVVGLAIFVMPWTIRNALLVHKFIPGGLGSGVSLLISSEQYSGVINYRLSLPAQNQVAAEFDERRKKAREAAPAVDLPNQPASESKYENPLSAVETCQARVDLGTPLSPKQEVIYDSICFKDSLTSFRALGFGVLAIGVIKRVPLLWSTCDISPWQGGWFHRLMQLDYALLVVLVILGIYLSRADLLFHWPLWIVPLYLTLMHLVFHFEGRYSIPGRSFILLYAGASIAKLLQKGDGGSNASSNEKSNG